jgi:hypothetical protein
MGGNEIVLLLGKEMDEDRALKEALYLLDPPQIRGHQAGILYKKTDRELEVKIVDITARGYIPMCGGLTQVLGKSLFESDLAEWLELDLKQISEGIILHTEAGPIPLKMVQEKGSIITYADMSSYINECYKKGVEKVGVNGLIVWKIGDFLVVRGEEIERTYADADLEKLNTEGTKKALKDVQNNFERTVCSDKKNIDYAVFDQRSKKRDHYGRIVFPHDVLTGHIEPACGTGTTAVGIAVAEEKGKKEGILTLEFESGGLADSIGGPDLTTLEMKLESSKVIQGSFSHRGVKLLASGKIFLNDQ